MELLSSLFLAILVIFPFLVYWVPVNNLDCITGGAYFFSPQLQLFFINAHGLNNKNCGGNLSMLHLLKLFKIKKSLQDIQGIKQSNKNNS